MLVKDGHRHGIIVIVSLHCCCRRHPLVVNHCFCWIVGLWPLSLSLCIAVVLVVVSSQDGHRHGVVVIVSLCCCCCHHPLVVNHCFCWIVGLLDFGHHHHLFVMLSSHHCFCCCCCCCLFWSSSLSLCVAVVIVIPLLSTMVLVGLLDYWIVGLLDCWIVDCSVKKDFVFDVCV